MQTTDHSRQSFPASFVSGLFPSAIDTEPSEASASVRSDLDSTALARWDRYLDKLIDWNQSPGSFDEDGYQSPSKASLARLRPILLDLKNRQRIPDRLVTDCWGGCTLEFFQGDVEVRFTCLEDGTTQLHVYNGSNLLLKSDIS